MSIIRWLLRPDVDEYGRMRPLADIIIQTVVSVCLLFVVSVGLLTLII